VAFHPAAPGPAFTEGLAEANVLQVYRILWSILLTWQGNMCGVSQFGGFQEFPLPMLSFLADSGRYIMRVSREETVALFALFLDAPPFSPERPSPLTLPLRLAVRSPPR
jgi:hypothetical protein